MSDRVADDAAIETEIQVSTSKGARLFDRLGGRPTIEKVHALFYDKLYAHPWLGLFFKGIDRKIIETQQTDFFSQMVGGPKSYSGRMPIAAHVHLFITEEVFETRHQMLSESLAEAGVPATEMADWLAIDLAFKKVLVKKSESECKGRFKLEAVVVHPNPMKTNRS